MMARNIAISGVRARKKVRGRSSVSTSPVFFETCAACGMPGVVGPEVGPLACSTWVHHDCWPAFYFDGLRACLTRSSSHTVVSRSIILSKTFVRVLDPVCRAGSHTRLKIM
jgi:hypothetical protein